MKTKSYQEYTCQKCGRWVVFRYSDGFYEKTVIDKRRKRVPIPAAHNCMDDHKCVVSNTPSNVLMLWREEPHIESEYREYICPRCKGIYLTREPVITRAPALNTTCTCDRGNIGYTHYYRIIPESVLVLWNET